MDVSLWLTIALSAAALAGVAGRALRRAYKAILFIKDLTQVVHERSAELTAQGGDSVRDRVTAIDRWRRGVDSDLADLVRRVTALERRRR